MIKIITAKESRHNLYNFLKKEVKLSDNLMQPLSQKLKDMARSYNLELVEQNIVLKKELLKCQNKITSFNEKSKINEQKKIKEKEKMIKEYEQKEIDIKKIKAKEKKAIRKIASMTFLPD